MLNVFFYIDLANFHWKFSLLALKLLFGRSFLSFCFLVGNLADLMRIMPEGSGVGVSIAPSKWLLGKCFKKTLEDDIMYAWLTTLTDIIKLSN